MNTGYSIEKTRQKLAAQGDLKKLKALYKSSLPEIKDLNTSKFWDDIYSEQKGVTCQDSMTKDRIKAIASFMPHGKQKVLDVGAGPGWILELISKDKHKKIYACDFSEVVVEWLKKQFKGNFSIQSVYNLKYTKNSFDVVLALELLEHVRPSKIFKLLKSINGLLKNDGVFIVSVPMNEGLEDMSHNLNGHVRMYTEDLIKAELEIAGFKILKSKTFYAFENYYKQKKIISKFVKNRWKPNNIALKIVKL